MALNIHTGRSLSNLHQVVSVVCTSQDLRLLYTVQFCAAWDESWQSWQKHGETFSHQSKTLVTGRTVRHVHWWPVWRFSNQPTFTKHPNRKWRKMIHTACQRTSCGWMKFRKRKKKFLWKSSTNNWCVMRTCSCSDTQIATKILLDLSHRVWHAISVHNSFCCAGPLKVELCGFMFQVYFNVLGVLLDLWKKSTRPFVVPEETAQNVTNCGY